MNTNDLFESAQLDALGLLDDRERAELEAALQAAPAPIRAQIREEYSRLTRMDRLLPNVEPHVGLRDRVIAAIRQAAGGGGGSLKPDTAKPATPVYAAATAEPEQLRRHAASRVPPLMPVRRVSPAWRAGTIGFATAAVVLGSLAWYQHRVTSGLQSALQRDQLVQSFAKAYGQERVRGVLFDPNTQHVVFSSLGGTAKATLVFNPEPGRTMLLAENLQPVAETHTLRLCELDDDGKVIRQVAELTPQTNFGPQDIEVPASSLKRLAIVSAPRGVEAVMGAILMRTT